MAHRGHCIYDNNHTLQVFSENCFNENRCLNVNISDFCEFLQVKLRDASDFFFNYTSHIDARSFEIMRNEQSLDIDFNEFKSNLIDMLHQVQKHEMFLKCESASTEAKLVFFGKSKIKSIIYLTVKLELTSKKEIFDEMLTNILDLQSANKNLTSQLQMSKTRLQDKDSEIEKIIKLNTQLERRFRTDLENLNDVFSKKMQHYSALLIKKILILTQRLLKLIQDVEVVKAETLLKSDSSARLLQSLENLRLESIESSRILNDLKRENCNLKTIQADNERAITDFKTAFHKKELELEEVKRQRDEFESDAKQAALIIAQKATANEELARDVVKANQMLVSFNHLIDTKNQEIEKLKDTIGTQDKVIQEHSHRFHELCKEFEDYKIQYNVERMNKLTQDLFAANKKVEEVEKVNRETAKLNELLTRKLASGDFLHKNYNSHVP